MTKETYEKIHRGLNFEEVERNIERLISMNQLLNNKTDIQMYFLLMDENKQEMRQFLEEYEGKASSVSIWKPHNWTDGRTYRPIIDSKKTCGRPSTGPLQVQWDGKVVPCCFDYDSKMVLGDFNVQTLEEIMRGREYNKIRQAHIDGNFSEFPVCDSCDQLNKRTDVLVYTNLGNAKVGATNTEFFDLQKV